MNTACGNVRPAMGDDSRPGMNSDGFSPAAENVTAQRPSVRNAPTVVSKLFKAILAIR